MILTGEPGTPVRVVPLPGLTESDAISQANRLLRARQIALGEDTSLRARRGAHHEILDILAWMWDAITGPVLTSLGHATTPAAGEPWPRVWWCPVGILGYLPLHASGHHDDITAGKPEPRTVLDRVISSYTTTVRGLSYARTQHPDPAADSALIVAVTTHPAPGHSRVSPPKPVSSPDLIPRAQILSDPTRTDGPGQPARPSSRALRLPRLRQLGRPGCQHARPTRRPGRTADRRRHQRPPPQREPGLSLRLRHHRHQP